MLVRRKFIQRVACSLGAVEAVAGTGKTVTYKMEGFTCVTCAVGLDTMLRDLKGIVTSKSSYPDRTAVIEFNPELVTEKEIKAFIEELGFKARC
jgi:copper chaperone CopZ